MMSKNEEYKKHRISLRYFHARDIRDKLGKKIGVECLEEFETAKGRIEANLWYDQARELILKYDGVEKLNKAKDTCADTCAWMRNKTDEKITQYVLETIIANPDWVQEEEL